MYLLPSHIYKVSQKSKINNHRYSTLLHFHNQIRDQKTNMRIDSAHNKYRNEGITARDSYEVFLNQPIKNLKFLSAFTASSKYTDDSWIIQDPRGFQIRLRTTSNLLLIANANIKQGTITSECCYAWDAGRLYLVPTNSDFYNIVYHDQWRLEHKIDISTINTGDSVTFLHGNKGIFLGKFFLYGYNCKTKKSIYSSQYFFKQYNEHRSRMYYYGSANIISFPKSIHISKVDNNVKSRIDIIKNEELINKNFNDILKDLPARKHVDWKCVSLHKNIKQEITLMSKLE